MIKSRLRRTAEIARVAADAAAERIEEQFKSDATTRRGNVPSYGKFGDVPIRAEARPEGIFITAATWVHSAARKHDEMPKLVEIVRDEVRKASEGR
jgi:hypothetical protein